MMASCLFSVFIYHFYCSLSALTNMKSLLLLLIIFAFFGITTFAQPKTVDSKKIMVTAPAESPVYEKIKTAKGMLVISNEPGNYFSIEIKGKNVSPLAGAPLRFQVDGKYLEITLHDKGPFVSAANKSSLTDLEMLEAHRRWYSEQIEKTFGVKLQVESSPLKLFGDKDVLAWSFPMPPEAGYRHLKRQVYRSFVKGDQILLLNSAWTDEIVELKVIHQLLSDTLRTLKVSDKPISTRTSIVEQN